MPWVPHITVAAIIEKNNEFLLVEEYVDDVLVINQPAGHLEEYETLEEACIRETLEETAYLVKADYLIGIYQERKKNSLDMYLRFCYKCTIIEEKPEIKLDKNIVNKLWLSKDDLMKSSVNLRSNMVLKCINDYYHGHKYSKNIINSLLDT